MSLALDHLVVAARTLEEGARWLEARTGVPTAPGGRHALMGTHNRLLSPGAAALESRLAGLGLAADAPVRLVEADRTRISAVLLSPRGVVLLPESPGME